MHCFGTKISVHCLEFGGSHFLEVVYIDSMAFSICTEALSLESVFAL